MLAQSLDIAIVLVGIYVALAIATSWLQEQIAALLKLRSNTLKKGVQELVSSDMQVFAALQAHPLIASARFPSYLASRNFTLAFWQSLGMIINGAAATGVGTALATPGATLKGLILDVNGWAPTMNSGNDVKLTAIALLTSADGDYDRLLCATDAWFDAQMDRVSGWYKRNAQYILIGIAFVVTFGAGIDSIDICRRLYAGPAFTQATSQGVTDLVSKEADATSTASTKAVANFILNATALEIVRPLWLPTCERGDSCPDLVLFQRLAGIFITGVATSLGAPFWFDVLKGLVNVRMAGVKPNRQ